MLRLVVGLGNPGRRYRRTRHNLGFAAVELLAARLGAGSWRREGRAEVAGLVLAGREIVLAKPITFMNLSGEAVVPLVSRLGAAPEEVVLVHDDLDLPAGKIRVRPQGSAGGHRGVASVLESLGTDRVGRVKLGIGRPPPGVDPADYVLEPLSGQEWEVFSLPLEQASDALEFLLRGGSWAEVMNRFNG
ncbi:MAG: aminoacyl-tRNA hydrolase [Clostridia bacterium]|nr:aminoacyl-tRNA hydrolase [Clostridia bacterium]MDH7572700.1 aminoacyl-tRNA hydrolase [Clostridia bacterium]